MMALFEPEELVIAILRLEGLSDTQIGAVLDLSRTAIGWRMDQARARIAAALPELADDLRDRVQPSRQPSQEAMLPLERGWICNGEEEEDMWADAEPDLTATEVADLYGISRRTVQRWIRAGRFPHAYLVDESGGEYRIPAIDLEIMDVPEPRGVGQ
jgi:excisionase family DNA binding protein